MRRQGDLERNETERRSWGHAVSDREKSETDRQTDRQTEEQIQAARWSERKGQLQKNIKIERVCS